MEVVYPKPWQKLAVNGLQLSLLAVLPCTRWDSSEPRSIRTKLFMAVGELWTLPELFTKSLRCWRRRRRRRRGRRSLHKRKHWFRINGKVAHLQEAEQQAGAKLVSEQPSYSEKFKLLLSRHLVVIRPVLWECYINRQLWGKVSPWKWSWEVLPPKLRRVPVCTKLRQNWFNV